MNDDDLLALCVLEEAGGESDDGRAAVARVVRNRMALKYSSDGTIRGTVLKYDQFSWAWFDFVNGKYSRVASNLDQATAIAQQKFAQAAPVPLSQCRIIAQQVMAGTYSGPLYNNLTDQVVLYLNPRMLGHMPAWAIPSKLVTTIGHHEFFTA